MNYITTYTKKKFDVMQPDADSIDIRDIAHALSLQCRGGGHVKSFFSVAQHCILCCREAAERGFSRRVVLACLLHDASEAYMCDIPRPIKKLLPEYIEHEKKLIDVIYEKYLGDGLTEEEHAKVKQIDDDLLYYDLTELLGVRPEQSAPDIHVDPGYLEQVPFENAENEYLSLFYSLTGAGACEK